MLLRQFQNFIAVLFGNETERQFRKRVAGDDGLCPLPLIAAADSIDLRSRSRPDAFELNCIRLRRKAPARLFLRGSVCRRRREVFATLRAPTLPAASRDRRNPAMATRPSRS